MTRHFITDIDLKIIKNLYNLRNNQSITTYSLAKKIFDSPINILSPFEGNKRKFFNNKTKYIDYRMNILNKIGIIDISDLNGKKVYTLILNNVYFKRIKYKKIGIDEEAVFLKEDNLWNIYFNR